MQSKLRIIIALALLIGICSCSKEDIDINDLNETIFVRHKNADMPAYIHGNGSEKVFLIILHGGPGGNGLWYRVNTIRSEIEKNNAIVYFDQRGSGNSQGNYSRKDVSLDVMAEDVLALAKVIKAKFGDDSKLFLLGHSWGGTLGPATLLKDQKDFAGWIDVAGAHDPIGAYDTYKSAFTKVANEQIALSNSVDYWNEILDLVQNVGASNNAEDLTKLNFTASQAESTLVVDSVINAPRLDYEFDVSFHNDLTKGWNQINIARTLLDKELIHETVSFTDRLSEITIPSLVLWGKYDLVVPTELAQEAFDNLGSDDKDIYIFEQSGHSPMASEPDLFAEKVMEFINSHK